jgi:hypothetical protein
MRCAIGSLAIAALFLFAGSLLAQQPDEDAQESARRQRFFEALRDGAAEGEGIGIVPVPRFGAPGPEGVTEGGDGVGIVRVEEAEFAPQGAIQFEAAIIHLASSEDFSEEELAVTGESVDELLQNWKTNGKVARMSVLRLTSVDNQEGFVTIGEQVPVTTARTAFGGGRGGPFQSSASYQDVGTRFGVRGRIDEGRIVIECNVEESRLETAERLPLRTVPTLGGADTAVVQGDELNLPSLQKVNSETVVSVADGGKVVLSSSFQKTAEGSKATIITLKASILP